MKWSWIRFLVRYLDHVDNAVQGHRWKTLFKAQHLHDHIPNNRFPHSVLLRSDYQMHFLPTSTSD